jgi:hypothetical protein
VGGRGRHDDDDTIINQVFREEAGWKPKFAIRI